MFDANFTKQLLDNSTIATQKNMPDYAGMAKAIEKNIQNIQNLSGNTYVNNFYIDGAQDTESILREIDKHLDKKIQAHDKKQVRCNFLELKQRAFQKKLLQLVMASWKLFLNILR